MLIPPIYFPSQGHYRYRCVFSVYTVFIYYVFCFVLVGSGYSKPALDSGCDCGLRGGDCGGSSMGITPRSVPGDPLSGRGAEKPEPEVFPPAGLFVRVLLGRGGRSSHAQRHAVSV